MNVDLDVDLDVDLNDAIPLEPDPIADAALEHTQQLAARPVAVVTDEQLMDVVGMMNAADRSMDAVRVLRSWLSTIGDKNGGAR